MANSKFFKHFNRYLTATGLICVAAFSAMPVQAAFVLTLDDPTSSGIDVVLADYLLPGSLTDSGLQVSHLDNAGGMGVISFSGAVGAFNVNVTTGVSDPIIGPSRLDLNSIDVSGSAGTLNVSLTDTNFASTAPGFSTSHGGTTDGTVNFDYLYGGSNQEFAGSIFASDSFSINGNNRAFSFNQDASIASQASIYSLSILTTIQHSGAGQITSFDATVSPVPIPASAVLFLSGLAAFRGIRSRV